MRLPNLLLCLLLAPTLGTAQEPSSTSGAALRARVTTSIGAFVIELDRGRAPLTVDAFVKHAKQGFYSGLIFHRVVAGFIVQGGGFTADLQQKQTTATVPNESGNGLTNLRGSVGFARSNEPHSGTSQFYVNLADNLELNPRPTRWGYAVFGKVVEGMEVVDDIGHRPTGPGGPFDRNVPLDPIKIERVDILGE